MLTKWGKTLNPDNLLAEYPRPQMVRESYLNLNGTWDYAITDSDQFPAAVDGRILVPFSPEAELSGVGKTLLPRQFLWYRRSIALPEGFFQGRLLLHFGAVDQMATVFLNGEPVGSHVGGYLPFTLDITRMWKTDEVNELSVCVRDTTDTSWHTRGKQKTNRGGIWYSPQSGIWQTVWLESVPERYIQNLRITPDFDAGMVVFQIAANDSQRCSVECDGRIVNGIANQPISLMMPDFEPWTPENPRLYPVTVRMGEDAVTSYFGMRKFSVSSDHAGIPGFYLNNQPIFQSGLLDQGYWSDGMLTAPSDDALIADIQMAKDMGFNMLRKHIKIEPLRWYYHCDRLGMLVWQDMPNGGEKYSWLFISAPTFIDLKVSDRRYRCFARQSKEGREQYKRELDEMLDLLHNVVSLAVWVPFNEGWGQFDARNVTDHIRSRDNTRPIDSTSGWYDQQCGDFLSRHIYFKDYHFKRDANGRTVALSEFGGYNFRVQGHAYNEKDFGYKRLTKQSDLEDALRKLYFEQIKPCVANGLAAAIYTQLSDVEDELNGLVTYDREVQKISPEFFSEINRVLKESLQLAGSKEYCKILNL